MKFKNCFVVMLGVAALLSVTSCGNTKVKKDGLAEVDSLATTYGFVGFHHFDTFGELFARTGFQRCDYFLCHIALKLFDFTMNGHLLQERVVFLALQTVGGVFLVLGRDVAGHSRNTASFLFRAFENHLHSVAFLCHLSLEF